MNFNASVFMSEQLKGLMLKAGKELAERAVIACAEHYKFDGKEAIVLLNLENVKLESGKSKNKDILVKKVAALKASFPLPFNGEFKDTCCYALRQNNGLYTQCQVLRKGENSFCKQCQDKVVDGIPEYGTIQQRMASGIFEYVDPKGRKPVSYTKVMKKYKLTQSQVEEEASKLNIKIDENHFVSPEADAKRGRPAQKKEKAPKEEKQAKGRPKKEKNLIQIEGDDDLFAALVADANSAVEEPESKIQKKSAVKKTDEEKEAERQAKESAKAEKEAKLAAEKAEKAAKLAAEKAHAQQEKEAKMAVQKAEKEAKLAVQKAEKEAKLAAEKAEKEAKLAAQKAEKEAKLAEKKALAEQKKEPSEKKKKVTKEEASDEEPEVVKKIEFEGKKYLKSKKTNIVYDYDQYTKNQEQIVVGQWNETSNKLEFVNTDEESEDEYDA